ncbi:uncharacterized protein L199_003117 [Kwoniella botswanensis]|uniref:uncharacterized protein n=1 Tax=Kwoniella botswanensis TaxID=1268659 RepID=UPI00315CBAAA
MVFIVDLTLLDGPVRPTSAPLVYLKRKRLSNTINEEAGPASASVNGGKEQDIKPHLRDEQFQYLEDRIKRLTSRLNSARNGEGDEVVDLTNDSDGD